ncbi:ABC transporter ATP-binding protein/permease [Sinomonas terrae]|uniref:ATP-binding cassette domain-containing protein n=1 Tax=Sinomonas terrae TaxID=2908838 RepID=A0ABS9U3R9_9MICC|nr:ATP-binding cassette domain-containing protein [Sinomonas terrae]MCH6471240.1 ATP-binding cassette domain-containing protein [Sinomonas terrae]
MSDCGLQRQRDIGPRAPAISLRGVAKSFDAGTAALRGCDLDIEEGDFVAIVGASGSGKSTLLNIIGTLDRPDRGEYRLHGRRVEDLPERELNRLRKQTFAFVFQESHVLREETAARNAALGLRVQGVRRRERPAAAAKGLARVGLGHRWSTRGRHLSGGERQRLAFARAASTGAPILLADEPTGNLDSRNGEELIAQLSQLNAEGTTVVVVTHDDRVAAAAHRRVRIADGVLIEESGGGPEAETRARAPRGTLPERANNVRRARWDPLDDVSDALSSATSRIGRSAMVVLAFALGVAGLTASVGLSESAAAQVSQRISAAALDEITVTATGDPTTQHEFFARTGQIREDLARVEGVRGSGVTATLSSQEYSVTVLAPHSVPGQSRFRGELLTADGAWLGLQGAVASPQGAVAAFDAANQRGQPAALIGEGAARTLGLDSVAAGQQLWIDGRRVDVVGAIRGAARAPGLGDAVVVNFASLAGRAGLSPVLLVRTEDGYPAALRSAIPLALDAAQPGTYTVSLTADLRSLRRGVSADLADLVRVVSWALLLFSGLGAASAMYLAVQSRSAEIALRRALGASRPSIARIFLLEGAVLGLGGGLLGSAFGVGAVVVYCLLQRWTAVLSSELVWLGTGIGAVVGVAAAVYPAWAAATGPIAERIRG